MDTKLTSDIAEHMVIAELLRRRYHVLRPVGDRLPYVLAVETGGRLIKIQVKSAWKRRGVYLVDSRRTKTNRRRMVRSRYSSQDFDIAVLYVPDRQIFYIMPNRIFCGYRSEITLESLSARSAPFKEAWSWLEQKRG